MLPEAFCKRMQGLLGEEYEDFIRAMEKEDAVRALRVNTDKIGVDRLLSVAPVSLSPLSYTRDAFLFEAEKIGNHPLHHAGVFYVQDPGAMAALHALPIKKGWRVADLCAAPGGKSLQAAAYIGAEGFLLSNEYTPSRCRALMENFERMGVKNACVTSLDTAVLAEEYEAYFDLVLVDAPCSGEGMFRKYAYAREEWSENEVLACAKRQRDILRNAAKMVKDGGYLLYSTCTFSLEENEMTVDAFLEEHSDFSVCPVEACVAAVTAEGIAFEGAQYPSALSLARRFYPHKSQGEGQFMCLLHRENESALPRIGFRERSYPPSKEEERTAKAFLSELMPLPSGYRIEKRGETALLVREDFPLPERGLCMAGVAFGTFKKGRIEPLHRLFSAFGADFYRQLHLSLEDERLYKYLRGETVEADLPNGYAAVLVEGCALGGVKVVNGTAKNHYPKGLRLP